MWTMLLIVSLNTYINFCVVMIIPCTISFKRFPNNEPWLTREIKVAINNKKSAFKMVRKI